jgi:hypothetical protein
MRTFAVALILVLAGCGGSADQSSTSTRTTATPSPSATTTKPTVAPPTGTPAPEALSKFRCAKTPKGLWNSSGYLANSSKAKATFQVTVYVGEATGGAEKAKTRRVDNVGPGGSARFVINNLPAAADGPCHVQVLVQR